MQQIKSIQKNVSNVISNIGQNMQFTNTTNISLQSTSVKRITHDNPLVEDPTKRVLTQKAPIFQNLNTILNQRKAEIKNIVNNINTEIYRINKLKNIIINSNEEEKRRFAHLNNIKITQATQTSSILKNSYFDEENTYEETFDKNKQNPIKSYYIESDREATELLDSKETTNIRVFDKNNLLEEKLNISFYKNDPEKILEYKNKYVNIIAYKDNYQYIQIDDGMLFYEIEPTTKTINLNVHNKNSKSEISLEGNFKIIDNQSELICFNYKESEQNQTKNLFINKKYNGLYNYTGVIAFPAKTFENQS